MLAIKDDLKRGEYTNTTMEDIRLWMYTLNGTVWYPYCLVWSCVTCFSSENASSNWSILKSCKITTAPRLVSEYLIKNENEHQIMKVHTNCNCLIPILSSLVMSYRVTTLWLNNHFVFVVIHTATLMCIYDTFTEVLWLSVYCSCKVNTLNGTVSAYFVWFGQILTVSSQKTLPITIAT